MIDFKVDIVGSFLRPDSVKEARAAFKAGTISREELTAVEDKAIAELVEKEVAHGLQFVTDGEFRRRWWHLDWLKEFDGFETIYVTKPLAGGVHEVEYGQVTGNFSTTKTKPTRKCTPGIISTDWRRNTTASWRRNASPGQT